NDISTIIEKTPPHATAMSLDVLITQDRNIYLKFLG
ncbi:unnamed protein product, partial [marine sediment metagenome]